MRFTKKNLILFLSSLLFINFSCAKLYYISQGFKSPYFETEQSLHAFMVKDSIDSNMAYIAKDSSSFFKILSIHDNLGKILTFNKEGYLLQFVEKKTCPGPVENYLNGICNRTAITIDSTIPMRKVLNLLKPLSVSNTTQINKSADLTIIIFWAVNYSKHNEDLHKWYAAIKKQKKDCTINVLFLNCDYPADYFGYTKRTKASTSYEASFPSKEEH